MRILMTGSTGFVGKNLVPKLLNNNHEILEITIEPEVSKSLYDNQTTQFYFDGHNVQDLTEKTEEFSPELVIHLASFLTSKDDTETMFKLLESNIKFTCTILDSLKNTNLKWFFNVGSFAEYFYGDGSLSPAYLYAATKSASRNFVEYYSSVYDYKYITIVPYTIYGGHDSQKKIIDLIYDSLFSEKAIDLSPGKQILDFINLEDVTDFFISLLENLHTLNDKTTFHLGSGKGYTLRELANIIENITGKKANINWGGKDYRPRDMIYAVANISEQYRLFCWKPKINLEEGVEKYLTIKAKNEIKR